MVNFLVHEMELLGVAKFLNHFLVSSIKPMMSEWIQMSEMETLITFLT